MPIPSPARASWLEGSGGTTDSAASAIKVENRRPWTFAFALANTGKSIPAKIAMTAITTNNSSSVNAPNRVLVFMACSLAVQRSSGSSVSSNDAADQTRSSPGLTDTNVFPSGVKASSRIASSCPLSVAIS